MKRLLFAAALAAVGASGTVPAVAADVGVSVSIGQPGFYGHVDIGGYPPPQLVYRQPVVIERTPVYGQPIYLNVPPGHAKHWRQHCAAYNACNERVYFVRNSWYNRQYVPRYQEYQRDRHDDRRNDRRDEYRGDQRRGQGNSHHGGGHDPNRNY